MQHGRFVHALLLAALALPLAAAQPWQLCGSSGNYSANSTYQANLNQLAAALPRNASSSGALFASGAVGTVPETAYALALCRGDTSASACATCVATIFQDAQQLCPYNKEVSIVSDLCYLCFSNLNFLASTDNSDVVDLYNTGNFSGDVSRYDREITRLLNATAAYAAGNSNRRFGTREMVGLDALFPKIYCMAQCTPDLSQAQCLRCLDNLVGRWWQTFEPNTQGARSVGTRCNIRTELYMFYTPPMPPLQADPAAPALAPAAVPGTTGGSDSRAPVLAPPAVPGTTGGKNNSASKPLEIILPIVGVAAIAAISLCMWIMLRKRRSRRAGLLPRPDTVEEDLESVKSTLLSLSSLQVATNNFDESQKLGEGGFGAVYKGVLSGQEVAVKRLSKGSNQGLEELKNELVLVAKLHHKNLVRLVGFSLEGGERLLVYEYMPNRSLDTILFDPEEKGRLDWAKRFKIIEGVARGLQYLHQDSQKKIIHRDLKASNVLLDADMNPKIGDFGLARLFEQDQTREVTSRIVGTFGYMSPEYVMRGQYSTKSDVFSFGILVIEIVTGRRNNGSYLSEKNEDIISIVWRHWAEGTIAEMIDHSLGRNYPGAEVLKCLNIGLLCLQQNPVDRPTMADIMVLLNSDTTSSLPAPARPTFFFDASSAFSHTHNTLSH